MSATMAKNRTNKPGGRNQDRHKEPRLAFHLPQPLFDAFKAHVASLEPEATDAAVLRLALERYLTSVGRWPPPPSPESGSA